MLICVGAVCCGVPVLVFLCVCASSGFVVVPVCERCQFIVQCMLLSSSYDVSLLISCLHRLAQASVLQLAPVVHMCLCVASARLMFCSIAVASAHAVIINHPGIDGLI